MVIVGVYKGNKAKKAPTQNYTDTVSNLSTYIVVRVLKNVQNRDFVPIELLS